MELRAEFKNSIKRAITTWDIEHPVDVLWRQEFKVPFLSEKHLAQSFIAQHAWFEEHKAVEEIKKKAQDDYARELSIGNNANERVKDIQSNEMSMTSDEIDDAFENMDMSQYETEEDPKQTKEQQMTTLQNLIELSKTTQNG